MRVTAIIELPPGLLSGTSIPMTLLVIENRSSTETLVARMTDDWKSQLSSGGAFLEAYRRHLVTGMS